MKNFVVTSLIVLALLGLVVAPVVMNAQGVELDLPEQIDSSLQAHLFQPAAMQHTGFFNDAQGQGQRVRTAYYSGQDLGSPDTWPGPSWSIIGSGGVMTTVGDMYRWYLALQDQAILSAAELKKLWTPYVGISGRSSYGYGRILDPPETQISSALSLPS